MNNKMFAAALMAGSMSLAACTSVDDARLADVGTGAAIGALAGLVAALGASLLAWGLARQVLSVPYALDPWVWLVGLVGGARLVGFAGWLGTRSIARVPPLVTLRRA